MGHQSTASEGASEVVLGNSLRNADPNLGASLCVRTANAGAFGQHGCWGHLNSTVQQKAEPRLGGAAQWAEDFTADRIADVVRYDSPSFYGFILSASWGDNDFADVALRFRKEFDSLRVAAAISYQWDSRASDAKTEIIAGSASVMHMPTGLYGAFAAGQRDYEDSSFEDPSFWYIQAGIERQWLPFGTTTIYGEYGSYNSFHFSTVGNPINNSEAIRWGFGVNQTIDAAAMDIYSHVTLWSFDEEISKSGLEDQTTVVVGMRIRF